MLFIILPLFHLLSCYKNNMSYLILEYVRKGTTRRGIKPCKFVCLNLKFSSDLI